MSKKSPSPIQQLKLDLAIDLSTFTSSIKSNFTIIWQTLNRQADEIQSLKSEILINQHNRLKSSRKGSRGQNRKGMNNMSLNYSDISHQEKQPQNPENGMSQSKIIQGEKIQQIQQNNKSKKLIQDLAKNLKPTDSIIKSKTNQADKSNILPVETENKENQNFVTPQAEYKQTEPEPENSQILKLIENKVLEINQRLQRVQLGSIKQNGILSKKVSQIANQLDRYNEALNKRQSQIKKVQFQIQKFRGELSQYKIKKQSQIMRMVNNVNASSSSTNSNKQYNQYLLEKIQELSNVIPEMMFKAHFDEYKADTKIQLARMERKIGEAVSNEEFQALMALISRKKADVGRMSRQNSVKSSADQNRKQIDINLEERDPHLQEKLISIQKQLKDLTQTQKQTYSFLQQKLEKQSESLMQTNARISEAMNQILRTQHKSQEYQQFMRSMNDSYNEKIKQIVNQIIECQQSIQKLNNQMKFYSYTHKSGSEQFQVGTTSHSSGAFADGSKITDMENDVSLLKKKVNKLALKQQSLKEDLLTVRQDFARDVDGLKSLLQKKCDWESLKKGMNYFDEKVKEIIAYIDNLQKNISQPQENGQSTAAKKGWTCLCCDKDIKQYQGKLGQAKFTSVFPSRYQSPRIGGYFKQKQSQKQYNQVFLKHNRRLSQNHTKSRDEII